MESRKAYHEGKCLERIGKLFPDFAGHCTYGHCHSVDFDRVGLITGGFTGLTIIIRNLTEALLPGGIPLWLTNIVLNIPIFLYSYIRFGKIISGNGLCNHFAFGVALSDTGDRYVRG